MNNDLVGSRLSELPKQFYHGTRAEFKPGELIEPGRADPGNPLHSMVFLCPNLDAAIWDSEIATGIGPGRVYIVEPMGAVEIALHLKNEKSTGHPTMSHCSREPLRVKSEVTSWHLYHGRKADLKPGELIRPGQTPNFGNKTRKTTYVYCSRTLNAAAWGAELAAGEGPGQVYVVEPTGPIEEDPNLTDKKFRGNPTKSFRSREPFLVKGVVRDWPGHSPEEVEAMKKGLKQHEKLGIEPIDD